MIVNVEKKVGVYKEFLSLDIDKDWRMPIVEATLKKRKVVGKVRIVEEEVQIDGKPQIVSAVVFERISKEEPIKQNIPVGAVNS